MPTPDRVGQLLNEREESYQGALQAGRNDLWFRERVLNHLKNQFGVNPELVADFDTMISKTRRARRDITSEGSYLFENDVLNSAYGIPGQQNLSKTVDATESGERKRSQPVPGTEAHHPASVSSTEALVQNMDEFEVRKLWDMAKKHGYTVGSQADGFIPLSKPAHTTGGRNWGSDYAHVGTDGKTPDPGRFKTTPLPKGTTAEQAWSHLEPVLNEQRLLNERAYSHPFEQHTRGLIEQQVGPVEWRGPVTPNRQKLNTQAKSQGVNATVISKSIDRNPGLIESGETPGVTIMTPVGAKVPPGMKKVKPPPPARRTLPAPAPKPKPTAKPKPKPKPNRTKLKPRGTAGVQPVVLDAPSSERYGPGGMIGTIDQLHERQFQWRR